jgi:hypothetical protein
MMTRRWKDGSRTRRDGEPEDEEEEEEEEERKRKKNIPKQKVFPCLKGP